jgi:ubiquinone biosynthesis accessory factor UbiJ
MEKATPAVAFCFFVNPLLERETWARERLARFAGETIELSLLPLPPVRLRIADDGRLRPGEGSAGLVLRAGPAALFALPLGEEQFLRAVDVSGNARLAQEIASLARHLRPDFEEELARVLGDVAAHRLAGAARSIAAWHVDAANRISEAAADFFSEEAGVLVRKADEAAHVRAVAELRDALARLEKRIESLATQ